MKYLMKPSISLFVLLFVFSFAYAQTDGDSPDEGATVVIANSGGNVMEGHTPRGFQGMGTGLFVGDNLNPSFPDGDGVQVFLTFDLSAVPAGEVIGAVLRGEPLGARGTPFDDLGALNAEEVRFEAFSSALWNLEALEGGAACVFAATIEGPYECDLSAAVQRSLDEGYPFAQFRLRFDQAGDSDGQQDMVFFFISEPNRNETGIFELEVTVGPGTAGVDLADGLAAHWPFDGDADDLSGNENHGKVSGARLAEDRFGNAESAYVFDGEDDFMRIEDSETLDVGEDITVSVWLLFEEQETGTFYTIFEKSDPGDGHARYGAWIIRDIVEFCVEPSINAPRIGPQRCLDSTEALNVGEWNHIVGVFSSEESESRVYVNGEEAGVLSGLPTGISRNDAPIFVGTDLFSPRPVFMRGALDDLRIYDRVLSEDEIRALFELEG